MSCWSTYVQVLGQRGFCRTLPEIDFGNGTLLFTQGPRLSIPDLKPYYSDINDCKSQGSTFFAYGASTRPQHDVGKYLGPFI